MSPSDLRIASVPPTPYLEDLFVARCPVERFSIGIDPELVIVDIVGAQPISTVHFLIKGINQALLLGLKFCFSNLTPQALDIVPGRVKLLLDARQEWVHNGVGKVKAIIIVCSTPVGVERGVFKIIVSHVRTTHIKVSHNFNTSWLQAKSDANSTRTAPSASPWLSKECGNLWSPPTILAASIRTSNCLSGSLTLAKTI